MTEKEKELTEKLELATKALKFYADLVKGADDEAFVSTKWLLDYAAMAEMTLKQINENTLD